MKTRKHHRYPRVVLLHMLLSLCLIWSVHAERTTKKTPAKPIQDPYQEHLAARQQEHETATTTCHEPIADGTCSIHDKTTTSTKSNLEECGIWLAPSSIPGAGLGMFAGRDFEQGEYLQASGDVVIPMVDITDHQYYRRPLFLLWDEYTWGGEGMDMQYEGHIEVKVASPGFGSAANCFIDLINVDEGKPRNSIANGLHRSKDPGAGAYSTYHDRQSTARVPIRKGEELYVDYGQSWFIDRKYMGAIPLLGDLDSATDLFRRFNETRQKHLARNVSIDIFHDLWGTFVWDSEFKDTSRTMAAFHKTQAEWQQLWANMTMKEIRIQDGLRSQEWLEAHGTCADNMREGPSTIRQAGRGAFAIRRLIKDTVVAPLPLIHVADRDIFNMLGFEDIFTKKTQNISMGEQLSVNYCYGHEQSTLLLCPYGPLTALINHNQTRANVKVQWADASKGNHDPQLLQVPIDDFAYTKTAKLAMELVALRDIEPDEEIFADYGDSWEAAWQDHVQNWQPYAGYERYVSAYQMNHGRESLPRLKTVFDEMISPYPNNIQLQCDNSFYRVIDVPLLQREGIVNITDSWSRKWFSCEVLRYRKIKGQLRYTAVVTIPAGTDGHAQGRVDKLTDAPREAFRFVDRPYTSDLFLYKGFRHPMMIPDDLFPAQWRNLKKENVNENSPS